MIERREVDGVPTVLAPSGGPMHAGLVFRVGFADETLPRRGITHLIEHLALHTTGVTDYHYNGVTGVEHTYFHLRGSAADITAFLTGVCASLRSLPITRLATEKEILRAEANGRHYGPSSALPLWRHGATDYGMPSYPEWGLPSLTEDDLAAWAARYFTRENAALWVAGGAIPAGLRLDLPSGERRPAPAASSALPVMPAFFPGSPDTVAWDTRVRREARASVFANVLERRMFRELRQEGGLSYQVQTAYEVRCGDTAVVTAVADALPEKRQAVLGGMIDILAAMRAGTIDPEDVTAVVNQGCDALSEAEEQGARLPGQAFNLLAGRPVQNIDEVLAGLRAVTADDVAEVGAAAYAAGLLVTPAGTVADWAGYAPAPDASESAVAGTAYPALRGTGRRLVAGADGVSVVGPDGPVTVRYDACAAVLSWPDGGRQVIGLDGLRVAVEPTLYPGAAAVARDLDTRLPAGLRVPMPERDPDQIPQPPPPPPGPVGRSVAWLRRVRGGLRRSEPRTWISLLGGLAATAVGAALTVWLVVQVVVGEQPDGLPSVLVVGGATAYGCLRTRRILRTLAGSR